MVKQWQVRRVRRLGRIRPMRPLRPIRPVAPVKTTAAALIAGAAVILAACSSGTSSSSASKAAAPHTTGSPVSPSAHSGSHMSHSGSAMAKSASATTSPASPTASSVPPAASPGATTANKSTCKHVNALRTSLQDLNQLNLGVSSADKIRADLASIQTHLAAIKHNGASSALSSQLNQLSTSVDNVRKAANGLSTPPTTGQISAIVAALTQLKSQSKTALAAMNAACPR